MGLINIAEIDTAPGAGTWASPPEPVDDYLQWASAKAKTDNAFARRMGVVVRAWAVRGTVPSISGPHADRLRIALEKRVAIFKSRPPRT